MDATQQIEDPFFEEEEEDEEEEKERPEREQLATLKVFKNDHIPEAEFPLYVGENVLGRDPATCSVLLPARSVSGRHAAISISVFRSSNRSGNRDAMEALVWDMGSLNGTRKGRLKLTPQVRYALTDGESVVLADVPCQYIGLNISTRDAHKTPEKGEMSSKEKKESPVLPSSDSMLRNGVQNVLNEREKSALPPVPLWSSEDDEPKMCSAQSAHKQPEITLVPESDSDGESATDERKDFVSDSTSSSHLCSSANSSFLTPAKKVIPESEDESSASMDRYRPRQKTGEPCSNSSTLGLISLNLDSDTDFEGEKMKRSETEPVPSAEFHMDSDTDVEEEELETSKAEPEAQEAVTLEISVSSPGIHMDSDIDVEEDKEDKRKPEPEAQTEQAPNVGPVSSADLHMDSDTDVDEEESEIQKAVTLDKPVSSALLQMDSDTDVEEDEEEKSKTDPKAQNEETPKVKSVPPADLHMDSDTDVEDDIPVKVSMVNEVSHPVGEGSDAKPTSTPGTELHMDSDTDVDEDNEGKEKTRDILSNSETNDKDPFKPVPRKTVEAAESQKASVGGKANQSEGSTQKKQDHHSQATTSLGEQTQAFGHLLDDWDLLPTQVYGAAVTSAELKPKQVDLEATQAYGTETDREEEQEEPLNHTQPYSNLSTAETQLILVAKPDDDVEEEEDEETPNDSHLSTADTLIIASTPRREEQTQHFSLFTAQTQLIWEGEDKEADQSEPTQLIEADTIDEMQESEEEENMKPCRRTHGEGIVHKGKNSSSYLTIAETQPMCEEEEATDADLTGDSFQKPCTRQQYDCARHSQNNSSPYVTIAETQPMCGNEAPDQDNVVSKPLSSNVAITETQPVFEDKVAPEGDLNSEVCRRRTDKDKHTLHTEKASSSNVCIPETQVCEDIEGQEKELSQKTPTRRSCRARPKKEKEVLQPAEAVVDHTITETQPMCEEEQAPNQDLASEISSGKPEPAEIDLKSCVTVAETQPIIDEDKDLGEDLTKAVNTWEPGENSSTDIPKPSSSHVTIAETQPMHVEDEGQEKYLSSKMASRRSRRGKTKKDEEIPQIAKVTVYDTITESQPVSKEIFERDEDLNSEVKSRRSCRGKAIKEDKVAQSAEDVVSSLSTITETQPVCEDGTIKDGDLSVGVRRSIKRRQKDDGEPAQSVGPNSDLKVVEEPRICEENTQEESSGRSRSRQRRDKTEVEGERPAVSKVQSKTRKGQEGKRKREKELSEDEGESEEEKNTRRGTRRKGIKQKCTVEERMEEKTAQEEKERMVKELEERKETERLQKKEMERLKHERKEQEEREQRQTAETEIRQKLERDQKELEEKERLKMEKEKRIRQENEQILRKKEEKDRLEKEEKERREREVQRQKEEEERIQLEKEQRENEEIQMRAREQKEAEERSNHKGQNNKQLDNAELEAPLVPPVRRTRRCSSSSMNSDQSATSKPEPASQRGRGRGRGRGRERQTVNKQPISARQSSQRGPAIGVEDTEQDNVKSRSSSRSSERSANSVVTSNQGTRGRGRKSVKIPEPEEVSQAKPSRKGRGRSGRRSGAENVNVGMSNEREQDAEKVEDNTATPQTNSRGRKRAANTRTTSQEAPSPTPKTPRRSMASQAHKVLFTGLTDEDGERVVSRLGGRMARGVNDMTHLVTDKARRTVKFLCAVARGVPIVSTDWLTKCGKAGHFLSTDDYILKDVEQEKKFSFCLQKTLQTAQSQPLLKGYEIHVTPSVMPEPSQMKEIITCCGARFLPKMPSAHKENIVVVSCEQDRALCAKAVSMSLPVVSTEFLLTGILQQRVDLQAYSLTSSLDTSNQPAAPKPAARGRRKQ